MRLLLERKRKELIKMIIKLREEIAFSQEELFAIDLVIAMSQGIEREAQDPELKKLAQNIANNLYQLWGYEE